MLNLLQHTAGFDDMHFNERYNLTDPPDLPLLDVLARNPASRRVRWQPGTRMSYSNPGYAVAAAVLEQVTGRPYEDVIRERIFTPLGMDTSSFVLTPGDEASLARGYDSRSGAPVPFSQIYLRPAGNLHTSAAELGRFVQMLLNWGETADQLVIDPEYLSNMERPRTSLSAKAGLIYGYGTGITSRSLAGFPVLGHNGGIDGFSSSYGYSAWTGRRVGGARQRVCTAGQPWSDCRHWHSAISNVTSLPRRSLNSPWHLRCWPGMRVTTSPKDFATRCLARLTG